MMDLIPIQVAVPTVNIRDVDGDGVTDVVVGFQISFALDARKALALGAWVMGQVGNVFGRQTDQGALR